jgi:hypothetical protein
VQKIIIDGWILESDIAVVAEMDANWLREVS